MHARHGRPGGWGGARGPGRASGRRTRVVHAEQHRVRRDLVCGVVDRRDPDDSQPDRVGRGDPVPAAPIRGALAGHDCRPVRAEARGGGAGVGNRGDLRNRRRLPGDAGRTAR